MTRYPGEAELEDWLAMGPKALYVENPADHSNRPPDLGVPSETLGAPLNELFKKAFVNGLHAAIGRLECVGFDAVGPPSGGASTTMRIGRLSFGHWL